MNFGEAIEMMKSGGRVARAGWNGKGMWIALVREWQWEAEVGGDARLPWIGMKTADNAFVPWFASQADMLAEDWSVAL